MSQDTTALSRLFEMSRDAVIGIENNTIVFANPAAEALLPLRAGDAAAKHLPEHILADPAEHFFASLKLGGKSYDASVSRQGGLTLLSIFRRGEEKSADPGWPRAMWEFGNSLISAQLSVDALVKDAQAERDAALLEYASIFYRSYFRLKRLQDHMTTVCCIRDSSLPFSPGILLLDELCRSVCDTVESLIRNLDIGLAFHGPGEPSYISGDGKQLEIMLLNLLSNSLLHTRAGDRIDVTLTRQGGRYVLAVDDGGSGISPERMAELFGDGPGKLPDAQAGAGLGLTVVRGIAERHGGALVMESRREKGTSLRISLPRPGPEDITRLRQPPAEYKPDGMDTVLTELSVVLDKSFYTPTFFD